MAECSFDDQGKATSLALRRFTRRVRKLDASTFSRAEIERVRFYRAGFAQVNRELDELLNETDPAVAEPSAAGVLSRERLRLLFSRR
jgi:hypothetical protein